MSKPLLGSSARALVLELLSDTLGDASGHVARLGDPDDVEAVHDFRVAVRRLRTFLRAFSGTLPLDDRFQLELRRLTELTNATRDDEAQAEWLRERLEDAELESAERHAATRTLTGLDQRAARPESLQMSARLVLSRADRVLVDLEGRLTEEDRDRGQSLDPTFEQLVGAVVDQEAGRLRKRLGRIETVEDARRIHRARLSEKRLRYVLETVSDQVRASDVPLERLKSLQDTLGELHDLSSFGERLAGAEPELSGLVRRRRAELFETLSANWLGARANAFFANITGITRTLREELS